jgi:heterodisulfide reductase subunit A
VRQAAVSPTEARTVEVETGAILLATGFRHYEPVRSELGYGEGAEVITLLDLIQLLGAEEPGGGMLRVGGRPVKSLALIHCVGSRQIPGLDEPAEGRVLNEHCSRVCCTAALQEALELRRRFPDTVVYELYRDLRTYGRDHEAYAVDAASAGVVFARFAPEGRPQVTRNPEGSEYALNVTVNDLLLGGEELEVPVDLVVLAVGMEAGDTASLVELLKLPVGADRFLLEVHPKLRPVELPAKGIYLAGTCQAPMDVTEACAAASAAAAKASGLLTRGFAELDPFVVRVDPERCQGHGACVSVCPEKGAIALRPREETGPPLAVVDPAACTGCGMCAGVCPEGALQIAGWTLDQYEAMVDALVGPGPTAGCGGDA